jgi:hypothetical protein
MRKTIRPTSGHILDIDASELADQYLSLARNVNTRKGFPSRISPRRIAYPVDSGGAPNDAMHLLNLNLNTFNWWMLFGESNIMAVEGPNFYNISFPGQQTIVNPYEWSSTLLNGIPVFSNGKDVPLFWTGDGGDTADELDDWPTGTVCKFIIAFRFHLFALNIDGPSGIFDNMVMWSSATEPGALPTSWTPALSNEAGSMILAETPGRCIGARALGPQLLTYKPTSCFAVEYVGQQPDNIFTQRPISRELGILGPACIADCGPKQLIVGNDDVALTDGVNLSSVADNRVKRAIASSVDETNAQNAFVVRDLNNRETWVCVPESGAQFATIAHIWDERRDAWTTRDLANVRYGTTGFVLDDTVDATWDGDSEVWDSDASAWNAGSVGSKTRVVLSEEDVLYVEDTDDMISVSSTIAKYDMSLDDDAAHKLVSRVYVLGTGLGFADVRVRIGSRNSTGDDIPITWTGLQAVDPNGTPFEVDGRYISVEIAVTSGNPWTVNKIVLEYAPNGSY